MEEKKVKGKNSVVIAIIIAVTILIVVILFLNSETSSNLTIGYSEKGATIIIDKNAKLKSAQFLLPASARWTDTGIELEANSWLDITASGQVHLAARKIIEASKTDTKPEVSWSTPEGIVFENIKSRHVEKRKLLIDPNERQGVIIAYFHKDGTPVPSIQNQRPKDMNVIKEHTKIQVPEYDATLWLIVNDLMLDPNNLEKSKDAFYGTLSELTNSHKTEKDIEWANIVATDYWDLWYDDNIGNYLVQIKILDKK